MMVMYLVAIGDGNRGLTRMNVIVMYHCKSVLFQWFLMDPNTTIMYHSATTL